MYDNDTSNSIFSTINEIMTVKIMLLGVFLGTRYFTSGNYDDFIPKGKWDDETKYDKIMDQIIPYLIILTIFTGFVIGFDDTWDSTTGLMWDNINRLTAISYNYQPLGPAFGIE